MAPNKTLEGWFVKIKFISVIGLVMALTGCMTEGKPKATDPSLRIYSGDLRGNGAKVVVEVQDKSAAASLFLVRVKNNDKAAELIDSLSITGKIKKVEFADLSLDGKDSMVIYFDGENAISNIAIYQLKNDKLSKIFSAVSPYGIEADFETTPRIKIEKAPEGNGASSVAAKWDIWVWTGDKFIRD